MASFRAAQVLYERACRARGYKESTINTAMANLKPFFSFIRDKGIADLRDVRRNHIVSFLEASEATHAKNTRRGMLISIRRLFRVLYEQKKIIMLPTGHLSFKASLAAPKEILSEDGMNIFLSSIDIRARQGLRDKALFELFYSSGLRSREASRLLVKDLNPKTAQVYIRSSKNYQDRLVPITNLALRAIEAYLPSGTHPDRPLFLSDHGAALRPQSINRRFLKWARHSGVYHKRLTVHSIRHSCARHLLARGAHLRFVQELLGHKSVQSTELYTTENDENLRRIYKQYHPRENSLHVDVEEDYMREVGRLASELKYYLSRHGAWHSGIMSFSGGREY